jgi:hypothetical protein
MEYLAILCAFLLGAYVRKPFDLKRHQEVKVEAKEKPKAELTKEEKLALEFYNAMNYNGKKQEETE